MAYKVLEGSGVLKLQMMGIMFKLLWDIQMINSNSKPLTKNKWDLGESKIVGGFWSHQNVSC